MFKLPFIKTKKKAFSLIDVIFAVLFVFIMLVLGLKLIFTSNQIEDDTDLIENITNIIANQIELYNSDPSLVSSDGYFYDEDFNLQKNNPDVKYVLYIKDEVLKENLHLLKFRFYDLKEECDVYKYEYKAYVP